MKSGRQSNYHKGRAAIIHYGNLREPSFDLRFKLYYRMTEAEKRALTDLQHYPMIAIIGCGVASIAVYLTTLAAVKIGKSYLS